MLDCSVSAAWCLRDEASGDADRYLRMLVRGEAVAPPLWIPEMTNVLLVAERKGRIAPKDVTLALELLDHLPIVIVELSLSAMGRLRAVASEHGLTAYDACYVQLALETRLPLASLDERMKRAARAARVRLL